MRNLAVIITVMVVGLGGAWAQGGSQLRGVVVQGFGDVGQLKLLAEQGDVKAQTQLADVLLSQFKTAQALRWYEAAVTNSVDAQYQAGEILLFGRFGLPPEETVAAKPTEGLKLTYSAAIAGNKGAWRNMAKALESGTGCLPDLVAAYAWLGLLAGSGDIVGRVEMNQLATKLTSEEIVRGKSVIDKMKAGEWPARPSIRVRINVRLSSITISPRNKLAIINNQTVGEGESADIKQDTKPIKFRCLKIEQDSVTIQVEGEDEPRRLLIEPAK